MIDTLLVAALLLILSFVIAVKTSAPPVPAASVRGFFLAFSIPAAAVCVVTAFGYFAFGG